MSIPATPHRAPSRNRALHWADSEGPVSFLFSCFLPAIIGVCITAFRCGPTLLNQFHCHVVSDKSAEKLNQADEHGFEGFRGRAVSVLRDRLRDAVDVGLRQGTELDLL